jgi:Na+/melibiose symporter-like transporter
MSTHDTTKSVTARWAIPGVAALAGLAYLVAGLVGDDLSFGIFGLVLMLGVGVVFVVASRWSETAERLRDRTDERINKIDRSATLVAGMTVLLAVLAMFVVEIAQGTDGSPYYQLGALGGVTYLIALVWLRFRR